MTVSSRPIQKSDRSLFWVSEHPFTYDARLEFSSSVALALRQQIIDGEVPMGDHDWKMDMVVGPDGIIGGNLDPSVNE